MKFEKTIIVFEIITFEVLCEKQKFKYGTKNALFGFLMLKFEKKYIVIFEIRGLRFAKVQSFIQK